MTNYTVMLTQQDKKKETFFHITTTMNEKKNNMDDSQMIDFDVLVHCLESGMDIYTQEEKELMVSNT